VFHVSIWVGLVLCLGMLSPLKLPRGDGIGLVMGGGTFLKVGGGTNANKKTINNL